MLLRLRFNRLVVRPLLLAALLGGALPAAAAAAATPPLAKSHAPLSPLLAKLAKPGVAERPPAVQDELLGVTEGPGGLIRDGDRVQVLARFGGGAVSDLSQLREAGARVVSVSGELQTATLAVSPEDLPAIASVPGVKAVWQARPPVLHAAGEGPCEGGSMISEGLSQLRVGEAREAFDLRGKGITIGVLSDSYDAATEPVATDAQHDVATNDLPGLASGCSDQQLPVNVLQDFSPGGVGEGASDEGRAMLQILHDLAPHAKLAFATAFESEESFAKNIERLAAPESEGGAGAEVIVDDVSYFEEPFFQDGPVAAAINKVTAEGVTYLTAAGNDNLFDSSGHEIASWEAPEYRDSGGCPAAVAALKEFNGSHCMDFNPGATTDRTFGITVEPGETLTLDLQWAEPWNGVLTDLDAILLSASGEILTGSVEANSGFKGTQRPLEIVEWTNEASTAKTVQLVINRFSGLSPRLKFVLMENGRGVSATEYPVSSGGDVVGPTIAGHAGAASAIAVAAVPFSNSAKVERYSSRGPVTHYFGPVEGSTPALPLLTPEEVAKPDLSATDCGATTFFATFTGGTWRFCGTSAAAPHAAAVAALLRQAEPTLTEQQVRKAMTATASPVGIFGPRAAGAGLVNALAAIGGLPGPLEGGDGQSEPVTPLEEVPTGTSTPPPAGPSPPAPSPTPPPATNPPETTIVKHPPRLVHTRRAKARVVFRFGSDQRGATFLCKVDRGAFAPCGARTVRRLAAGNHVLKVEARGLDDLTDPTPAVFRFRIVRR